MDELIVKVLHGHATDIEVRQLDRWRAESAENEREYNAFVSLWNESGEPATPVVSPLPFLEGIVREGDSRRANGRAKAARRALLRSPWAGLGLTAAAAATVAFLIFGPDGEAGPSTPGLFPVESSSSAGDITTLGLSDGSVIRTMPETRVEFPSAEDRREVVLEGKAFFAVAADPIPFVVRTRMGDVTVRGTRFEVLTRGDELRLVVVDGLVRMESEGGVAEVGAGQVAYLSPGSFPRVVDHGDIWSVLEWTDGLLIYESTPLSTVAAELGRHFGREVTVTDANLGQLRITAWFEDEPMEEVVSAVCMVASVPCQVTETGVRIGR